MGDWEIMLTVAVGGALAALIGLAIWWGYQVLYEVRFIKSLLGELCNRAERMNESDHNTGLMLNIIRDVLYEVTRHGVQIRRN